MTKRRTGRRPGDSDQTRQAVLDAARTTFGANGFDRATIRSIAAEAKVDPSLVMHYFGDKRALFVAAHEFPADPAEMFSQIAKLPIAERGQAVARTYLQMFASPGSTALSLIRAATTEPSAAAMLREFVQGVIIPAGLPMLNRPDNDGEMRMMLLASHLLGLAFARTVIEVAPVTEPTLDDLAATVAPAIQSYIDGQNSGPES